MNVISAYSGINQLKKIQIERFFYALNLKYNYPSQMLAVAQLTF